MCIKTISDIQGDGMNCVGSKNIFSKLIPFFARSGCVCLAVLCFAGTVQSAAQSATNPLGLKPASLPQYTVGAKYVYSDGTWETVTHVGPNGVTWINHQRNISTGLPDFTYKRSKWRTRTRYGFREFQQTQFLLSEPTTTLWPLTPGNKTRYDEYGRWYGENGIARTYESFWKCEVGGTEKVSVPAGDFDTWKITCKRYPNRFRATSKTREIRSWYYAPSLNHWVLEVRDYNGYRENRRKELVAVLPDPQAFTTQITDTSLIQKQFQNTLESNENGDTNIWDNFQEQLVIGITPQKTFKHGNGTICRQYQQVIAKEGIPYEYPGIACKNSNGRWVVPRR